MTPLPIRLALLLAGICSLAARADDFEPGPDEVEGAVRTWHTAQGLPSDYVTAVIQTRDGFLWIGTSAGLVRFDGTEIKPSGFPSGGSIQVTALCEDSAGNLWIGTQQNGLFELANGKVSQFTKGRGLLDDAVTSLAADKQGSVWVGTRAGLNISTATGFKAFTARDGLPDDLVQSVYVARSGNTWVTTRGGMCRFVEGRLAETVPNSGPWRVNESQGRSPEYLGAYEDRRSNFWAYGDTYLMNLSGEGARLNYFRGAEGSRIWSLCEGNDGRLWVGTSGQGLMYPDNNRFQRVFLGDLDQPYDVRAICEDRERNLWLGTSGRGLVQLRPQPVRTLRAGQGLSRDPVTGLGLDQRGRLLVSLQRGKLFVNEPGRFERFAGSGGLEVQDFISSFCTGRDGVTWAGTLGGGLYGLGGEHQVRFTTANGLSDNFISSVCTAVDGSIWASTCAGTVHRFTATNTTRFDAADGLPGSSATILIPASAGGVWLGTEDGAVLRNEDEKFVTVLPPERLAHRPVFSLCEGRHGRLWIGTIGGGLACLTKASLAHWNTNNGFPSDVVAGIVKDGANNLWLATAAGVYRVSESAIEKALAATQAPLVCKLISEAKTSTQQGTIFGATRALLAPDGKLWFATSEGVLNVDAAQPEMESSPVPLYIESAAFNGEPSLLLLQSGAGAGSSLKRRPMTIHGRVLSLDIHFTALAFSAPEKVHFRHKLEGFDTDWVDDGRSRFAHYSRLPYGPYKFRVAARTGDGPWQEVASPFAFEAPIPIYLRAWALCIYGILAVAVVAGIVRMVSHRRLRRTLTLLEQQRALERERMRIARDMHDEMGSKLTKLSFLSEHARVEAPSGGPLAGKIETIAETSRELLQTMDEIVWAVNPRNDTLEQLVAYLGHYAVEYFQSTAIECDLSLPRALPHHALSSETRHNLFLAFEEALNNVLKHSAASSVKVEMIINGSNFEIRIGDNGRGFEVPTVSSVFTQGNGHNGSRGNGLRNMRQRLAEVGGECVISSQPGKGTTVSMRVLVDATVPARP